MPPSRAKLVVVAGLVVLMPLLDIGESLTKVPRSLSDLSDDIVTLGGAEFRDCTVAGPRDIRAAALAVASIEAHQLGAFERLMEWGSVHYLPLPLNLLAGASLGPAQIKVRTAQKYLDRMAPTEIAARLLADPCWSLQIAAAILSDEIAKCRNRSEEACIVAAAAKYNGQTRFSGPNLAYRIVFEQVYRRFAKKLRR